MHLGQWVALRVGLAKAKEDRFDGQLITCFLLPRGLTPSVASLETGKRLDKALFDHIRIGNVGKDSLSIGAVVAFGDLLVEVRLGEHGILDDCLGGDVIADGMVLFWLFPGCE